MRLFTLRTMQSPSYFFLLFAFLVCIVTRLLVIDDPWLNVDEASFAAGAVRAIEMHQPVLKESRDNKPPGVFFVYEAAFRVGGIYNMQALRWIGLAWVLATSSILLFYFGRLISIDFGNYAAGFYLIATSLDVRFIAFKTEIMLNLPLVIALALIISGLIRRCPWRSLMAGAVGGLAIVFKQPSVIVLAGLGLSMIAFGFRAGQSAARRQILLLALCYAAGVACTLLSVVIWYWLRGSLEELLFQIVQLPLDYSKSNQVSNLQRFFRTFTYLEEYTRYNQVLFLTSFLGLIASIYFYKRESFTVKGDIGRHIFIIIIFMFISALVEFLAAPDLYQAYFILLFVPMSLATAVLAAAVFDRVTWESAPPIHRLTLGGLYVFAVLGAALLAAKEPVKRFIERNKASDPIVATLEAEKRPGDSLYVWGYRPQLYVLTRLVPATRFTVTDVLVGATGEVGRALDERLAHPYYEDRGWDKFMSDLERERPRFIVDTEQIANRAGRFSLLSYPRMRDYVLQHYDPVLVPGASDMTLYRRRDSGPASSGGKGS